MNIVEVYRQFPTEADCIAHLEQGRWKGKPICPYCSSDRTTPLPKEHRHHCNNCNTTFSVTVNSIFHRTRLPLQKWFLAISLILNARKGISARQLARDLDINKNTAWYISMRIRKAMIESSQRDLLQGLVEMNETYIGGKPRKKRPKDGEDKPKPAKRERGTSKTPVVSMMERSGRIKAKVVQSRKVSLKYLQRYVDEFCYRFNHRKHSDLFGLTISRALGVAA